MESVAEPDPVDKADRLLDMLASRQKSFGARAPCGQDDWPLVCARGPHEFQRLVGVLRARDLIRTTTQLEDGVELTFEAWERVRAMVPRREDGPHEAFVAMWFDASMNQTFDACLKPALHDLGYDPVRVDREHFLGTVDNYIVASIRRSRIVVADFTGHRSGVYWEAGFAHGLGLPVIYTCRKDCFGDVHFDANHYNFIVWETEDALRTDLRDRVEATITDRPKPRRAPERSSRS